MSLPDAEKTSNSNTNFLLIRVGLIIFLVGLVGLFLTFYPSISQEIKYSRSDLRNSNVVIESRAKPGEIEEDTLIPVDEDFSLVVPKIRANARVIRDVNPYNASEYQQKLTQGVAHAEGSVLPGLDGNTFLFAHSSDNFYNANRYNAVFYLLSKMELGDEFNIVFNKQMFNYNVISVGIVDPDEVQYITGDPTKKTATLMTCWPPGTTLKRLLVVGELEKVN